ncbi:MAG: hypothetical protein M1834_002480 [Cirrosporium novae-zelandiae]|nr:MAG: hypothetical protein M1834_002480 [Cirrosporium novae-zelandiae]
MHKLNFSATAISRVGSQSIRSDLAIAYAGIATSLREFHISASRAAEEDGARSGPPRTDGRVAPRTRAGTSAIRDVQSLSQHRSHPSAGIDARSLGARPSSVPAKLLIRRSPSTARTPTLPHRQNTGALRSVAAQRLAPGQGLGQGNVSRGGRGGRGGNRGGRGDRGRRGRRRGRDPDADANDNVDVFEVLTPEEKEYFEEKEKKKLASKPYSPPALTTTETGEVDRNALLKALGLTTEGPAISSSASGQKDEVERLLRRLGGLDPGVKWTAPQTTAKRLLNNEPVFFTSATEREQVEALAKELAQKEADEQEVKKGEVVKPKEVEFQSLQEQDRKDLLQTFVAGRYDMGVKSNDRVLRKVEEVLGRNPTWLSPDRQKLIEKVQKVMTPPVRKPVLQKPPPPAAR